ncbi:hypothetical protein ACVWYH_001705 [Bradyrhizobium sp. GM24.11]
MRVDALGHGKAQAARRQRLRLVDAEIVLVVAAFGADIEHIAKAVGRNQRGLGAAPLDDGIGRQRRAVNEDIDVADMRMRVSENETHSIQHRLLRPLRRRQHLAGFAHLAHVQHDVGERATDINGKPHLGSLKHSKLSVLIVKNSGRKRRNSRAIGHDGNAAPSHSARHLFNRQGMFAARAVRAGMQAPLRSAPRP